MSLKNTFLASIQYYQSLHELEKLEAEFVILVDTCSLKGIDEPNELWDKYLIERNKHAKQRKKLVKRFLEKAREIYPYKLTLSDQHEIAVAQGNLEAIKKENSRLGEQEEEKK